LENYNTDVKPDGDANNTVTVVLDVAVLKLDYLVSISTTKLFPS